MRKTLIIKEIKNKKKLTLCGAKTPKNQLSTFFLTEIVDSQGLLEIFFVQKTKKLRNLLSFKALRACGQADTVFLTKKMS